MFIPAKYWEYTFVLEYMIIDFYSEFSNSTQDLGYLPWWHQVKWVKQEKTEALDKEHIVAVFPHQEEGKSGGTHGKIAKHLQRSQVYYHV